MGTSERYTTERNEKALKKVEETLHDYGGAPGGAPEPPTTRTLSHTIHRQKTGVYPQTWKKGII